MLRNEGVESASRFLLSGTSSPIQSLSIMNLLFSLPRIKEMSSIARRGMHSLRCVNEAILDGELFTKGRKDVINASLQIIRERAKLERELVQASGGARATSTLLGVPLGPERSFLQGPAFAPPLIREAIRTASKTFITEEGKDIEDFRVLADVGDIPLQEIRDCRQDDKGLMDAITNSVKEVMDVEPLLPLVLGGDNSISFPVVRAISDKLEGQVDILHFGAHPGLDTHEIKKYEEASTFARIMAAGYARKLVQVSGKEQKHGFFRILLSTLRLNCCKFFNMVGLRSKSKGDQGNELEDVEQHEMKTYFKDRETLGKLELGEGASSERKKLGEGVKGIYVSINVNCLDPTYAPGVCHKESGGLSLRQVLNILQNIQGNIVGGDVVGYNPQRDCCGNMTAVAAAKLVRELAAKMSKP